MTPAQSKRYTPKISIESLRQKWLAVNPADPKLNDMGVALAKAARCGPETFAQMCRQLEPEVIPPEAKSG